MLLNSSKPVAWETMEQLVIDCGKMERNFDEGALELMGLEDHSVSIKFANKKSFQD